MGYAMTRPLFGTISPFKRNKSIDINLSLKILKTF